MRTLSFAFIGTMLFIVMAAGYAQTTVDCSDPLSASSDACAGSLSSTPSSVEAGSQMPRRSLPQAESTGRSDAADTALPRGSNNDRSEAALVKNRREENGAIQGRVLAYPPDRETEFQRYVNRATGHSLPIFGASLFRIVPSTFAPVDHIPVTADYVLGPEDELRIRIWGQVTYDETLTIDRGGNVFIPLVGSLHVAGITFSEVSHTLRTAIGRLYRNFDLTVELDRTRSIQVYVTGQARSPGAFTVSSLATLVDALFASGGPSSEGSFRHILLKRDGRAVTDFDLYDLLVRGDKSGDVHLSPEDVIYIPPAGAQVAITGSVRNPAIYELRDTEDIGSVLHMAGNISALSSTARISIERIDGNERRHAVEFALDKKGMAQSAEDGDILRVYQILPAYNNTVTLKGAVADPGRFSWHSGLRLSDILPNRDALMTRNYWWKRSGLDFESLDTGSSAAPAEKIRQVGQESGSTSHSTVADETARTPPIDGERTSRRSEAEIDWHYAVIERMNPETLKSTLIPFDLGKLVIEHDNSQDLELQAGDTITIYSQADIRVPVDQQTKYVDLEGEIVNAGIYSIEPGETLQDLVRRGGGLSSRAYLYGSEFTRESARLLQQARIDEYVNSVNLEFRRSALTYAVSIAQTPSGANGNSTAASEAEAQYMERLSHTKATGRIVLKIPYDNSGLSSVPPIPLENGDRFVVPPVPTSVNVVGAVYDQNSFLYSSGENVAAYIRLAGGPTRNADRNRAYLIRADGSVANRDAQKKLRSNTFLSISIHPGDTVVIPEKGFKLNSVSREIMDWSQSFSQLAIGAATVSLLK
jgi:protein involved in polysaccharide export with SLBB domain